VGTTDVPYDKTSKQLGGILVPETKDMNHAVQFIVQHPAPTHGNIFEIRPAAHVGSHKGKRAATETGHCTLKTDSREKVEERLTDARWE
jgi:hypothetical protein